MNIIIKNKISVPYLDFKKIRNACIFINHFLRLSLFILFSIAIIFSIFQYMDFNTNVYINLINTIFSLPVCQDLLIYCISILEIIDSTKFIKLFILSIAILTTIKLVYIYIYNYKKKMKNIIIIDIIINILVIMVIALYLTLIIYLGYLSQAFNHENISIKDQDYLSKIDIISSEINDQVLASSIAFGKILNDVKENKDYFFSLEVNSLINFNTRINSFVELKGNILNKEEHYFRNYLNRAPLNLETMLNNYSSSQWILMDPTKAAYHMYGDNGEFNIKFISTDGHFEAVYNRDGILLTADNDPINMGTYNYADPNKNPIKHLEYDVNPYDQWGNIANLQPSSSVELSANLIKFYDNLDAKNRYNEIKIRTLKRKF